MSPFEAVRPHLARAGSVVFVTGAGVSQESGIPTFRGRDGLWRRHDPMRLATIGAFWEDPALVWEWYEERRQNVLAARPNAGHLAVAEMEGFADVSVLTQNIDGLHQRAGSSRVVELHGSIVRTKCTSCDFAGGADVRTTQAPPRCACGALLRPDVVWFGEPLDHGVWERAARLAGGCDVMVVAGTSLEVSPANSLPAYARGNGAAIIEVNPAETALSAHADLSVRDTAAGALPGLVSEFAMMRG